MPFLTAAELNSHLYPEIQNEISREDQTLLEQAITAAIAEVGAYLSRFDRDAVFNAVDAARSPIILLYTKDVAVWHFIQLGNPNVDLALRERRYDWASTKLKEIQKGIMAPDLPLPPAPEPPDQQNYEVRYGSARTRNRGNL